MKTLTVCLTTLFLSFAGASWAGQSCCPPKEGKAPPAGHGKIHQTTKACPMMHGAGSKHAGTHKVSSPKADVRYKAQCGMIYTAAEAKKNGYRCPMDGKPLARIAESTKPSAASGPVCPVMGKKIASSKEAAGHSTYKGKTYYFCCAGCKPKFDRNPAGYIRNATQGKYEKM